MAPKVVSIQRGPLSATQKLIRLVYFSPLIILMLERLYIPLQSESLSSYLHVETVAVTKTAKQHQPAKIALPPLDTLTTMHANTSRISTSLSSSLESCPSSMILATNVDIPNVHERFPHRKIPKIVHQTSKSKCLTPAFAEVTGRWKLPGYAYYFHDDNAISNLFALDFPEFPHMKGILRNCLLVPTIKADLWRYLILWLYGGIYADFDTAPVAEKFNSTTIEDTDDGFFVVEQYHVLSQWFMAMSPRHPLMYYAIQTTLQNLLDAQDLLKLGAPFVSGPHALHQAYTIFRRHAGVTVAPIRAGNKPVWNGTFVGTHNRSIRVVGIGQNENEYVQRMAVSAIDKAQDYRTMGMTHFSNYMKPKAKMSGQSCLDAMLADVMTAI